MRIGRSTITVALVLLAGAALFAVWSTNWEIESDARVSEADAHSPPRVFRFEAKQDHGSDLSELVSNLARAQQEQQRKAPGAKPKHDLVVAIPTSLRENSILLSMVADIVRDMDTTKIPIVVQQSWNARNNSEERSRLDALGVKVVQAPNHPQLATGRAIPLTLGDDETRVRWRANHVLDYAHLLEKVAELYDTKYALLIEDDLLPARFAIRRLLDTINAESELLGPDWAYISLFNTASFNRNITWGRLRPLIKGFNGGCGAVALTYRVESLSPLAFYLRQNLFEFPVDILLSEFFHKEHDMQSYERVPNLFQHMGHKSTFDGNGWERYYMKSNTFEWNEEETFMSQQKIRSDGFIGCFKDDLQRRDMNGAWDQSGASGLPHRCAEFCQEFKYFALQYFYECYCSNDFGQHGRAPDQDCNMACTMTTKECPLHCGGPLRNSVFSTGLTFKKLPDGTRRIDEGTTDALQAQFRSQLQYNGLCNKADQDEE
eukprot:m.106194 g.106194  ORF g.106194 m.106194 type:complete len:489 (+) comp9170_c0_seq2:40-1506(+)